MVLDFRALNEKNVGEKYPLPEIVDILDQSRARYFSVCDLAPDLNKNRSCKTFYNSFRAFDCMPD